MYSVQLLGIHKPGVHRKHVNIGKIQFSTISIPFPMLNNITALKECVHVAYICQYSKVFKNAAKLSGVLSALLC